MKDVNKVILVGRLGVDPILRETKGGKKVAHFSLATSYRTLAGVTDSEKKEQTQWHRVVVWNKTAEHCHRYLTKGSLVFLEGTLQSHQFEDKEGVERTVVEVHGHTVNFLSVKVNGEISADSEVTQGQVEQNTDATSRNTRSSAAETASMPASMH